MTRWDVKDDYNDLQVDLATWETRGDIKVHPPRSCLQSNVLTCKLVRLARPVDSGNCRRSPPKTSIPAATSGRPPVRQSALPSDHFGKGCSSVVPRFFRFAPVAVGQTRTSFTSSRVDTRNTCTVYFTYVSFDLNIFASNKDFAVLLKFKAKTAIRNLTCPIDLCIPVNLHNRLLMIYY